MLSIVQIGPGLLAPNAVRIAKRFGLTFAFLVLIYTNSTFAATFLVTKTADTNDGVCDSDCSLREAIATANASPSNDVIQFDPQVFNISQSIALTGGRLFIENNGSLQIAGPGSSLLSLLGNQQGSVIATTTSAPVTISDLTIANGAGGSFQGGTAGGGITNFGTMTLDRVVVKNNLGEIGSGAGIHTQGDLTMDGCAIIANQGNGIYRVGGTTVIINNSLISENSGTGFSGTAFLTINGSTISNNGGGGVAIFGGSLTINNSTISGNYGPPVGAGINAFSTTASLTNSTVAFNRGAGANGAGIKIDNSTTFTARNSIIAKNTGNSMPSDIEGTLNSQGYNLIGTTAFVNITGNTTGNILNTDPKLLPLAWTGGVTPTHSLGASSPAIDAGDPANVVSSDQRGITRPIDGNNDGNARPDIGSVEAGILVSNTNDSGSGSLRQAILDANATTANDEIRFSTLFDTLQTITLTSGELNIAAGGLLLINGPGRDLLTISGDNQSRVVFISAGSNAAINNLRISSGKTINGNGGGICNLSGATLKLSNISVVGNSAHDAGGVFNSGTMVIDGSLIELNSALEGDGGGIGTFNGTLTINNTTLSRNEGANGGAIDNKGLMSINNSRISNNVARSNGGGFQHSLGDASISNSVINGNTSLNGGGGIFMTGNLLALTNSTISGNTATTNGGGGIAVSSGTINFTNATIAYNISHNGGGVFVGSSAGVNARNTIIAKNTVTDSLPDFAGTLNSQGYNLLGDTTGLTVTGNVTGNLLNIDPLLLPLTDNGGLSQTHALPPNSPSIDAGDPVKLSATDERGFNRMTDGNGDGVARTDMGAYEFGTVVANTNNSGAGSLRQAILDINSAAGDEEIRLSTNTSQTVILTSGELIIGGTGKVTIYGNGYLTISGNNQSRVFNVRSFGNLTLNGVTLTNGFVLNGDGGCIINQGTLSIINSVVTSSTANGGGGTPRGGGGIYNSYGKLVLANSTVRNNILTAGADGGGILNNSGRVEINDSTIIQNTASGLGGGISNFGGTVNMSRSSVNENTANRSGGINNVGTLTMTNSAISNNVGQQLYGGIYNGGVLTIDKSTIVGNFTNGDGGGVFNLGIFKISSSIVSGNFANKGGGIYNSGGINNDGGILTALNSTISGNQAANGNPASTNGGGIFAVGGTLSLTNVTFAFNLAKGANGGGVANINSVFIASNSIFAQNTTGISSMPSDFTGTLTSQGYNLIGNTTGTMITGTTTGNILGQDPMLDPRLALNAGMIPTHALKEGSPAIDAGSAANPLLTTDQRGFLRPYDFPSIPNASGGNGSDIGAFERQANDVSGLPFANVDGRVLTSDGRGLRNATVSITDALGVSQISTTSSFGFFSFANVATNETYVFRISSRFYRYAPRTVFIDRNLTLADFVGLE